MKLLTVKFKVKHWVSVNKEDLSLIWFFFLSEDRGVVEEEERRKRMEVVERFQTAPFEEIAAQCGARVSSLLYSNKAAESTTPTPSM